MSIPMTEMLLPAYCFSTHFIASSGELNSGPTGEAVIDMSRNFPGVYLLIFYDLDFPTNHLIDGDVLLVVCVLDTLALVARLHMIQSLFVISELQHQCLVIRSIDAYCHWKAPLFKTTI